MNLHENSGIDLWEILIPTLSKEGKHYTAKHHEAWDNKVKGLAGGLNIMKAVQGAWVDKSSEENKLYEEKAITVKIICDDATMDKIIDVTLKHYNQTAIMAYKIATNVIIRHW